MLLQFSSLFLACMTVASSSIISSPGLQRKNRGETCTFLWTVHGSFASYSVHNRTTGQQSTLSPNANHTWNSARGIISLTIRNVQLWDAGNYSLSMNMGTSTTTDAGALLFVYGTSQSLINQTDGSIPAIEGSTVELTCTVTPTSLPASYRPKIYYFWTVVANPHLRKISGGPATLPNNDEFAGYSFRSDGRILVVDSVQYHDRQINCWGQEEGSSYVCCSTTLDLQLHYRPQVLSRTPSSRRFHTDVSNEVRLSLSYAANPLLTLWSWNFTSTAGVKTPLPTAGVQTEYQLVFNLPSSAYYGNYTITLINSIGTTTEIFQVLRPAPPDTPSNLKVVHVTHRDILLQWNCMWFNGHKQTVSVLLKETASNIEIEIRNTTLATNYYNVTHSTRFQNNIRPETSYEASIWSHNALGSSDVTTLVVKTPKRFKLVVSPTTIVINGTQATIDFTPMNGNVTYLSVTCCAQSSGSCNSVNYYIVNATYRVVYNNLPDSEVYFFDFVVYGGGEEKYYLTMVKGIRVSRTGDDDDGNTHVLFSSAIVLAVLLGIAVLALVGSFSFILIRRNQRLNLPAVEEKKPRELPNRPLPDKRTKPKAVKTPRPPIEAEEETYEVADAPKAPTDDFYMPLNEKPRRANINQYS